MVLLLLIKQLVLLILLFGVDDSIVAPGGGGVNAIYCYRSCCFLYTVGIVPVFNIGAEIVATYFVVCDAHGADKSVMVLVAAIGGDVGAAGV